VTVRLDSFLQGILIILMGILIMDVTWQVLTRYLFGSPSSVTEEIARYLLIWIGLLGAALAYRKKMHLSFDLLSEKAAPSTNRILQLIIHSLIAFFSLFVLVLGGLNLVNITWELNQVSASLQIRLAYVYLILPISGVLIVYYAILFIIALLKGEE